MTKLHEELAKARALAKVSWSNIASVIENKTETGEVSNKTISQVANYEINGKCKGFQPETYQHALIKCIKDKELKNKVMSLCLKEHFKRMKIINKNIGR